MTPSGGVRSTQAFPARREETRPETTMKTLTSKPTRRARLVRALERGVTLIEILIVLAIVGLIAGGVAIVAIPRLEESRVKQAKIDTGEIHRIAEAWRGLNASADCPTVERLKTERQIAAQSNIIDPWGSPYKIVCTEDDLVVSSAGPDKKEGTKDDIRIPEAAGGAER